MINVIEKIPFPAIYGTKEDKENFYTKLNEIEKQATSVDSHWENFYYIVEYLLPNGEKWLYYEDTEYGIPSSLERVA